MRQRSTHRLVLTAAILAGAVLALTSEVSTAAPGGTGPIAAVPDPLACTPSVATPVNTVPPLCIDSDPVNNPPGGVPSVPYLLGTTPGVATDDAMDINPPPLPCVGPDKHGNRIAVVFGHPANVPDLYDVSVDRIRKVVQAADAILARSSSARQHLRLVCDATGLPLVEDREILATTSPGTWGQGALSRWLHANGFSDPHVKYVLFTQESVGACFGEWSRDDQPGKDNLNNQGATIAYLGDGAKFGGGCWIGRSVLHEIGHTLGAVQYSAPRSNHTAHCTCVDSDVMGGADVHNTVTCALVTFDCGGDEYYNPTPDKGSYLDTHWNIANSYWLTSPKARP